eukprot:3940536-Rhodomonas_salina.2
MLTEIAFGAMLLRGAWYGGIDCYAMCGTEIAYGAMGLWCYQGYDFSDDASFVTARCGTGLAYAVLFVLVYAVLV